MRQVALERSQGQPERGPVLRLGLTANTMWDNGLGKRQASAGNPEGVGRKVSKGNSKGPSDAPDGVAGRMELTRFTAKW